MSRVARVLRSWAGVVARSHFISSWNQALAVVLSFSAVQLVPAWKRPGDGIGDHEPDDVIGGGEEAVDGSEELEQRLGGLELSAY